MLCVPPPGILLDKRLTCHKRNRASLPYPCLAMRKRNTTTTREVMFILSLGHGVPLTLPAPVSPELTID